MAFRRLGKTRVTYWTYNARTDFFYDIGLCVIARPAPRTPRPLAGVPNPYPYGCSVLCNHPKDPELKDVVWKPRHPAHDQHDEQKKKANRANGDNESFYHGWDETDNHEEGATNTTQAAAHLANLRRCTSSGPLNAERRLSKADSMLVLDLRPWKSFDNVSSANEGQHDAADNLERFELTSPPSDENKHRARSTIRRPETFSSKSTKELLVTGVQKSCLQKSDVKKPVRVRTVKEQTKKAEVSEARWDVESERSQVSQVSSAGRNPVIWVDIVSKVMSQASGAPSTPTTPSLASPRRSLPDTFQDYLRENLRLMAEIRTAKKRRLYNRHILRAPDEDLNWTSNAPRPCRPPLLLALAQVRKKRRRNESLDIPPGLSGVRVQATEKVKRAASRTFGRLKKRRSVDGLEFTFNDDLVFEEVKLKKRKKKRRVKKKAKKTLRRSASSKSKESKIPRPIPDANIASDYDDASDCGANDAIVNSQADDTITSHTETLEEKDTSRETEEREPVNETHDDVTPQQIEELEETLRNIRVDGANEEQGHPMSYPDPYRDMDWLNFPRAGQTFGARFELPIDLRKLKNMTPIEYLGLHVVATRCRNRLNHVVFERHANESLPGEKLLTALAEILGFRLDGPSEEKLNDLIRLRDGQQLSEEQFSGIGALAERIARAGVSERDDLEISDFDLLKQKLSYLQMSDELRNLFLFICQDV